MRVFILAAGAALSLAACGNDDQAENTVNVGQDLTAENIVANDVTAIDAVTSDASNMAADVDINFTNELAPAATNGTGAQPKSGQPRSSQAGATKRPPPPRSSAPAAAPKDEPASPTTNSAE